jgi:preprotein translocase subunit SecB
MATELTEEQSKELLERVRVVSDRVQIRDIKLLECAADQKLFDDDLPRHITTNITAEFHFDAESLRLVVYPHLLLMVKEKDASPNNYFVKIEARFAIVYALRAAEGLDHEHFDAFAERNGIYNVWPYWREFVQSMTVRMGLPPLTVPVFRVGTSKLKQDAALPNSRTKQIQAKLKESNDDC